MRSLVLFLWLLEGCASGSTLHEASLHPSPLRADPCGERTGVVLTPSIHAPWDEGMTYTAHGELDILWCGEGTLELGTLEGQWGYTFYSEAFEVALAHGEDYRARLRGNPSHEGEVVLLGHVGETVIRASTFVIIEAAIPPSEGARRCREAGGELRTDGLLGAEACDRPTTDHSASCSTDAECDGVCMAERFEPRSSRACPSGLTNYVMVGHCSEGTLGPRCRVRMRELVQACATDETIVMPAERCE